MASIPSSWVDKIFDRMHGNYGSIWSDRWRTGEIRNGVDVGTITAKATWLEALSDLRNPAEQIRQALDFCKKKPLPPTLPEFLDLCRQARIDDPRLLNTVNHVDKERAKTEIKLVSEATSVEDTADHLRWAKRPILSPAAENNLMDCVERGDHRFFEIFRKRRESGWLHGDRAVRIEIKLNGMGL